MGQDKALLPWNSHALVEEVAATVRNVAGNVALVGQPARYAALAYDCLPDLRPGSGPLAGIEAALAARRASLNLIVACDMPGIETGWLLELLRCAKDATALSTVVRDEQGMVHPLCAVYHSACLPAVRKALDEGRLRARDLVQELHAEFFDLPGALHNLNTPQDWLSWQRGR
jgi:molybdenum cofactor guanylyltransferase